jgi:hypothetical protein
MADKQQKLEVDLDQQINLTLEQLSDEQQEKLSKALFPRTHTSKVTLCGKQRELHPLTVKYSRRLHEAAKPFAGKIIQANQSKEVFELDDDLTIVLFDCAKVLVEVYGEQWADVKAKLEEEDVLLEELQGLLVAQQELQQANDFLLAPLRLAIKLMQVREMLEILQEEPSVNMFIGQSPAKDSTAALMS